MEGQEPPFKDVHGAVETKERIGLPKPEVIANPPLENLGLVYSIPVAGEWRNGVIQRNLLAMLSQRVEKGNSIEINYIINNGNEKPNIEAESKETLDFLKLVVGVQKLAHSIAVTPDETLQQQLEAAIQGQTDQRLHNILELAAQKHETIAISAIDARKADLINLGYKGKPIARLRTLGADYADSRLNNKEALLMLYDADTIPATNTASQQLIDQFANSPSQMYTFLGISYLPPAINKDIIRSSIYFTAEKIGRYNLTAGKGSPQICFRISAIEKLGSLSGHGRYSDEDIGTASELISLYGPQAEIVPPTSLTTDRDGFVDGLSRFLNAEIRESDHFDVRWVFKIPELDDRLRRIYAEPDPQKREEVTSALAQAREKYILEQQLQLRTNRTVLRQLLTALKTGEIRKENGHVSFDAEAIAERPFGKILIDFLNTQQDLILSFTDEDISGMEYYVRLSDKLPIKSHPPTVNQQWFIDTLRGCITGGIYYDNQSFMATIKNRINKNSMLTQDEREEEKANAFMETFSEAYEKKWITITEQGLQINELPPVDIKSKQMVLKLKEYFSKYGNNTLPGFLDLNENERDTLVSEIRYVLHPNEQERKTFQFLQTIREYFGEYRDGLNVSMSIDDKNLDKRVTDLTDRTSLYYPFIAETLAVSSVYNRYYRENDDRVEEHTEQRDKSWTRAA